SRPAAENRVDRDPSCEARHCEPVRNAPVAPVENSRDHRHQHCGYPWPSLKHDCCRQTGASARFASCTLGLSGATLKSEVLSSQQKRRVKKLRTSGSVQTSERGVAP